MFELPLFLQRYLDHEFEALSQQRPQARQELQQAVAQLSRRYLKGPSAEGHLSGSLTILAYLSARLPATYAAGAAVLEQLHQILPEWQPQHVIDLGAGPGSISLAAQRFFQPAHHLLYEADGRMIQSGQTIFEAGKLHNQWQQGYLPALPQKPAAWESSTLWLAGYVLNELKPAQRQQLYHSLQSSLAPEDVLVLIEPGTPAGYQHLLEARQSFLEAAVNATNVTRFHLLAPCPHENACPLSEDDWCHFAERLPRSPLHRFLKGGDRNFEDEKYAYLIFSQMPAATSHPGRLLRQPRQHKGHLQLRLCGPTGVSDPIVSKKQAAYKILKKAGWGDGLDAQTTKAVLS
jgi:ribosomal protein RSM22 (predicted rRNA methylase)